MTSEGKFESHQEEVTSKMWEVTANAHHTVPKDPGPPIASAEDLPKFFLATKTNMLTDFDFSFTVGSGRYRMWSTIHKSGCGQSCTIVFPS